MKKIIDWLCEDYIDLMDDYLIIDFNRKSKSQTSIDTSFGKYKNRSPYTTIVHSSSGEQFNVLSVYKSNRDNLDTVRKLKYSNDLHEIDGFVNRTAIYLSRFYDESDIDLIIIPYNSRLLIMTLANKISDKLSINPPIVLNIVEKMDVENIHVNIPPNVKDKSTKEKTLNDQLTKLRSENKILELNKFFGRYRHFLTSTQKIDPRYLSAIENKNILILDDIITSSKTIFDIAEIVYSYGARTVNACTIFKHQSQ